MERWQSGRSRYLGKVVYGQPCRGFESPSLRRLELARDTMFRADSFRPKTRLVNLPITDY